ncbi:GNAT family N-acetyltransferase [Sinisalibacter aestuarii]|uniref:N-acetyltransferase domain-containing protein n=1 Tax=Sinisalibacter aestuarii TaxID=2949426 RepID=A0ABQ5LQA9_9RHOB|nr:GNAT family N-acetyltransferase [Sinisalibacter aestuarii]GKY86908.1 hypothetical protein STA1M1_07770 [Sinisalibacter aestuarii]
MTETHDEALRGAVVGFLTQHANAVGQPFSRVDLSFTADDGAALVGGLIARITQGWMYIELLGVSDAARGKGWGRQLMRAAEAEARARGLTGIWLDTYTFQAPGFYTALGFEEFGRIEDYPEGEARIFFRKRLG